jgi:hypothetical protein
VEPFSNKCFGAEIHGVVVGERHAGDAQLRESLGSDRRRPEEAVRRFSNALAAIRDTALEIEEEQD